MPTMINGRTVKGIAIDGKIIKGLATEGNIIYKDTLPRIFGEIEVPETVPVNVTTTFKVRTNRNTSYLVTYRVGTDAGISRAIKSITDLDDGTREIAFTMSFGSKGAASVRIVPAVTSTANRNDDSQIIINFRVV